MVADDGAMPPDAGPLVMVGPWLAAAAAAAAAATCRRLKQLQMGFVTPKVHKAFDHMEEAGGNTFRTRSIKFVAPKAVPSVA